MNPKLLRAFGLFSCAFAAPSIANAQVSLTGSFIDYVHLGTNGGILNSPAMTPANRRSMRYRETAAGTFSCDTFGPGQAVEEFSVAGQVGALPAFVTVTQGQFVNTTAPAVAGRTMTWTGRSTLVGLPVELAQTITFDAMARHITVDVRVTNRGMLPISNLHYLRNGDPDFAINNCNEAMGGYDTANDVVRQPAVHPDALVVACSRPMQSPFYCLGLGAPVNTARAHVTRAGLNNTDPVATWSMPNDANGAVGDRGISLVFRNEGALAAGASVTFSFNYVWGTSPGEVIDRFEGLYCLPPTVDSPLSLTEGSTGPIRAYPARAGSVFSWDLDNDGTFETMGNPATFSALALDGPTTAPIAVRYTNPMCAMPPAATRAQVAITNVAPNFTSMPGTAATAALQYSYRPTVSDPAGAMRDPPAFRLVNGPMGMTVNAMTGEVLWTPTMAQIGMSFMVTIEVSDGDGGTTRQSWTIIVGRTCADADMDGFPAVACGGNDCNDMDRAINPGATELCDNVDNNCSGARDEGFVLGAACTAGVGACAATGTTICTADRMATQCNATPAMPGRELCGDMIDNDCNGMTDEGFNVGAACTSGVGACSRMGTFACAMDRMSAVCSATAAMPGVETCNGVDDDCNGMTDDLATLCMGEAQGTRCTTAGGSSFCGCATDADCGGATSGRVCDGTTRRCIDGCAVGMARNGCPMGQFCTSNDPMTVGQCTMTCNFDADCAASMPTRPICNRPDAGPGPSNVCVECTTDAHCAADARCNTVNNRCEPRATADGGAGDGSVTVPDGSVATDGAVMADGGRTDGGATPMDGSVSADGGTLTGTVSGDGACACRAPAAGSRGATRSTALLGATAVMLALATRRRRQDNKR
jgi:hypothetical protein